MKSKMTTEDLIEDVLLEIFKFLDKNSLISARETCQRWMDVIDDNPGFYKDIKLDICDKDSLQNYMKLKYQKIRIIRFYPVETVRAILDYHKNHIKDFCGCNWSFVVECAAKFKHLEKLKFSLNWSPPLDRPIIVNFPELKELKIGFSESTNLENFKIIAPKLEKLHIQNKISDESLLGKSLERYPNLKSLSYDMRDLRNHQPNKLFLNYLATKCENMQEFHFKASEEELKTILSKTTITHLDTYWNYGILRLDGIVNTSIKKLSLHFSIRFNDLASFEEILKSCPNVENVIFKNPRRLHPGVFGVVEKFRNVQHITFSSSLYGFQKKKIDLSSILSLSIKLPQTESFNSADLLSLLLSCRNLKRLKLRFDRVQEIADEFITTVLQKLPELEEFKTDSNILLSENLVEYLKKGNFKLQKLKIQTNYPVRENLAEIYKTQRALANKLNGESKIKCILLTPENASEQWFYF